MAFTRDSKSGLHLPTRRRQHRRSCIVTAHGYRQGAMEPGRVASEAAPPSEDWVLVWQQNETGVAEDTDYATYLTGLSGGCNGVNSEGWSKSPVGGTAAILRYRSTYERWAHYGPNSSNRTSPDYHMDLGVSQGWRWRVNVKVATRSGNGGSTLRWEWGDDFAGGTTHEIWVRCAEDVNTSGLSSVGAESILLYLKNSDTYPSLTVVYGQSFVNGQEYELQLTLDADGLLTFAIDDVDVHAEDCSWYAGTEYQHASGGENVSPNYFGNNANAGWQNERFWLWR